MVPGGEDREMRRPTRRRRTGVIIVTDEAQAQATGHDPTDSSSRGTKTAYSASPLQICRLHAMM